MSAWITSPMLHGANADIDQVAEQLANVQTTLQRGAWIKALSTNSGIVYVGLEGVTTATGYPLSAGQELAIPVDKLSNVYVIASADNQAVRYIGI